MGAGVVGGAPYTHAHAHTCTHMHTHACVVNMIISCKWLLPGWNGFPQGIPIMTSLLMHSCVHMHACVCMHMCTCMGHPHRPWQTPTPIHLPPTPQEHPRNTSKFNSTWTNQDISILFEDLKSVEIPPPMGGCIVWWVGGWVGWWVVSSQNTKNLKIVDWMKIIQFCLKIYDL